MFAIGYISMGHNIVAYHNEGCGKEQYISK